VNYKEIYEGTLYYKLNHDVINEHRSVLRAALTIFQLVPPTSLPYRIQTAHIFPVKANRLFIHIYKAYFVFSSMNVGCNTATVMRYRNLTSRQFYDLPRQQTANNMEHNSSLEPDSCQSSQEISSTLLNTKVHHTVQIPPIPTPQGSCYEPDESNPHFNVHYPTT